MSDLVAANVESGNVSVRLGVGDGTFFAAVRYAAGSWPSSVAIADLNRDQVTDLPVSKLNSNKLSALLGAGNGSFAAAAHSAARSEAALQHNGAICTCSPHSDPESDR